MAERTNLLAAREVGVSLRSGVPIIEGVTLEVAAGEILGLVGESGSGKSTLALALLGFARVGCRIVAGSVTISGQELIGRRARALQRLRGRVVSFVPQDPAAALNPSRRIRKQILDRIPGPAQQRNEQAIQAVIRAQLPHADAFIDRFPHQLSGGQQQRAMVAMAISSTPGLVVLDEPTTGLDTVTQSRLLAEFASLRDELGLAMVYVTHDIAAVSMIADSIAVMYAGRIVEKGSAAAILAGPKHPYTRGLLASVPDPTAGSEPDALPGVAIGIGEWPSGCAFAPRCTQATAICANPVTMADVIPRWSVRCAHWRETPALTRSRVRPTRRRAHGTTILSVESLTASHRSGREEITAANNVSFSLAAGECLALVGESGSGKTTIARCIAGLHPPDHGEITLAGKRLAPLARARDRGELRRIQIVFQNPSDTLNPRHTVGASIVRPARTLAGCTATEAATKLREALGRVRLPARVAERYPRELSGGERQRAAIARALVVDPSVLICDEITSALDVSVQAAVLELLRELQVELELALLFITHDLGVVANVADRVLVLERGRVCEAGGVEEILDSPREAYTRQLVEAAPRLRSLDG